MQWVKDLALSLQQLCCRCTWVSPLAQELLHAVGMAKKKKERSKVPKRDLIREVQKQKWVCKQVGYVPLYTQEDVGIEKYEEFGSQDIGTGTLLDLKISKIVGTMVFYKCCNCFIIIVYVWRTA